MKIESVLFLRGRPLRGLRGRCVACVAYFQFGLRILLRALRIRCVFFLSLRILLRRLRIRCVKFRSLRILLRALRILLRISLRNGLALRALRCVRRMEIGLQPALAVRSRCDSPWVRKWPTRP